MASDWHSAPSCILVPSPAFEHALWVPHRRPFKPPQFSRGTLNDFDMASEVGADGEVQLDVHHHHHILNWHTQSIRGS